MPLDQGTIISKRQQMLQDHAERINNVLDIPIKLREAQMENKKTIEADSFGICVNIELYRGYLKSSNFCCNSRKSSIC